MSSQVTTSGDSLGAVTAPGDGGSTGGTTGLTAPGGTSGSGTTGSGTSGGTTSGGTSGTSGTTPTTPTTTNRGGSTSGTSGTVSHTPLELGFVLTATSNASQFGVSFGNTYTERQVDDAVVAALNTQGGLVGHRIVPVYASTDTGSSNWDTDFAAACSTFTQDHKVAAVLGYAFTYSQSFERCLSAKKIPHLNTGFNVPGRSELAKYPLQTSLDVPTIDRRGLLKLIGGAADGVLTSKNKIGVITDNCPGTASSLQDSFMPQARKLGLTVAPPVTLNCANGSADAGGAVTALQNAELQFASSGVDRVIFHASSEGPALLLFSSSADSQNYHPQYVVSSLANLEALRTNFSAGQINNIHGYGWLPTQDVPPRFYPATNSLQKRCLSLLKSQSVVPASGPDFYYAYNVCEAVFVYEQALLRNGASTDGAAVSSAVRGLGSSFASLTNAGGSLFGTQQPDAPRSMRHLVYTASCSCFAYTGPTRSIPTDVT